MTTPHHISGWSKIGIELLERLKEEEQAKLNKIGDYVTRKSWSHYTMFRLTGMTSSSGDRPLVMMYRRRCRK